MKIKIISTIFLLIALFPAVSTFRHLDNECFFLGCSILKNENVLYPFGIKVSLYMGCPSSIEFTDAKKNDISCYFSWIPNSSCEPQPQEKNKLLYYVISDTHLYLCESDSIGETRYKELKRDQLSNIYEKYVDKMDIKRSNSRLVSTDVADCVRTIDARDSCFHLIIMLVLLLVLIILDIVGAVRMKSLQMSWQ